MVYYNVDIGEKHSLWIVTGQYQNLRVLTISLLNKSNFSTHWHLSMPIHAME